MRDPQENQENLMAPQDVVFEHTRENLVRSRSLRVKTSAVLLASATAVAGCGSEGVEDRSGQWFADNGIERVEEAEELEATYDSERRMIPTLQLFEDIKEKSDLGSEQAALLTQAAINDGTDPDTIVATHRFFREKHAASNEEAVSLTVASSIGSASNPQFIGGKFEEARNVLPTGKEEAANIASISAITGQPVQNVAYFYPRVESTQPNKQLVPLVTAARMLRGNAEHTSEVVREANAAGVTDHFEVAAIVNAKTFTSVSTADLLAIQKELAGKDISPAARADLIVASAYNDLDVESTVEMYNFAGNLEEVSQEAAAKLVLATVARDNPAVKAAKGDGQDHRHSPTSTTTYVGGGYYPIFMHSGGYSGYSSYYPHSSSGFRPVSHTNFSRPGQVATRPKPAGTVGNGRVSISGGKVSGSSAGRGGVSGGGGRGGVGS